MDSFAFAHVRSPQWQKAAESCLSQMSLTTHTPVANLGFLYVTDLLAGDLADILEYFKRHTGVTHWVGTVGIGICSQATEYFDTPALAVMVGYFPENTFRVFTPIISDFEEFTQVHQDWYAGKQPVFAVVHGDPRNSQITQLVSQLSEQLDEGFLVGGLTSSRTQFFQIADTVIDGGLSGVLFTQEVAVTTRLTQGCSPLGARHQITQCENNIIIRIDGRPALDVFNEDIGEELAKDLSKAAGYIFAALPIAGSDTGDYMVRNLVGVDPENKLLAIGELVTAGTPIMFTRRDTQTAYNDLVKMLNTLKRRLTSSPKGGIYCSCLGRGENLFGKNSRELKTIQSILGDFPLVGFFANGEIYHQRLYGYTGVLTLFL
ncbi:MAG: histidine kinase [Beggiatoa sp. IS2]|nr:MAG: histidine kinase [Beggiatoa sp. IS2]